MNASGILPVKSIVKLARKHGDEPFTVRDECLIALTGLAGFNATELSLLRVPDLITERGKLTTDGYLPPEFSVSGHSRYFYIGLGTYTRDCLDRYIQSRIANGIDTLDRDLYAGLNPESYFFLKNDGSKFDLTFKNRFQGDTLTQPVQMQRLFKSYYLGEGVSANVLLDSFIVNFWQVKSQQGTSQAIKDLIEMTGLTAETLRKKCIRKQSSIQEILGDLYK